MKKSLSFSVMALFIFLLGGCSSNYAIHTSDGRTIVSAGKPAVSDSGLVAYKDANGVMRQINRSDVVSMEAIK